MFVAMASLMELLKNEQLIASAIKVISGALLKDVEKKFDSLITKGTADFTATITAAEKSGDLMIIELLTNFGSLVTSKD